MWGGGSGPTIVWGVWRVMSAPGWWGRAPLLWPWTAPGLWTDWEVGTGRDGRRGLSWGMGRESSLEEARDLI